jgi:hypothetical protein
MYGAADTEVAAIRTAQTMRDQRVRHFFDPEKEVGKAIAHSLAGDGQIAWDVYLFYRQGALWQQDPPQPVAWAHQLNVCEWADLAHQHCGEELVRELRRFMDNLTNGRL